jgi:hypothetical protein
MAKRKSVTQNYLKNVQQQREIQGDVFLNTAYGMAEKLGLEDVFDARYKAVEEKYGMEFAQPTETRAANTTNPERPRALHVAYIKDTETLLIQYRDKTIVEYESVPPEMWQDLKSTDSTGKYIDGSGIYSMPYTKIEKEKLPNEIGVLFD